MSAVLDGMAVSFRVFIGYDEREHEAAEVAAKTLREVTRGEIEPEFLMVDKLRAQGLLWRNVDARGQAYDLVSQAPQSTEFAISRFLAPILAQSGYVLFVDSDVVFLRDPRELLIAVEAEISSRRELDILDDDTFALPLYVVKHNYWPKEQRKMLNKAQTSYYRKNWSSVMLFACEHFSNRRLSLRDVNERPGRDLHAFYWLANDEIGTLDPAWNVLIGVQEIPPNAAILHYTLGGPFIKRWKGGPHDDIWLAAKDRIDEYLWR